jgi:WD40 repeat protein
MFIINEQILVTGSDDNTIICYNIEKHIIVNKCIGHHDPVLVVIPSNNNEIFSGSSDKSIKLWNIY